MPTGTEAAEIAETLINGNISDARHAIITAGGFSVASKATVAILTLDVLAALHEVYLDSLNALDTVESAYHDAHEKLRRCLEGTA